MERKCYMHPVGSALPAFELAQSLQINPGTHTSRMHFHPRAFWSHGNSSIAVLSNPRSDVRDVLGTALHELLNGDSRLAPSRCHRALMNLQEEEEEEEAEERRPESPRGHGAGRNERRGRDGSKRGRRR